MGDRLTDGAEALERVPVPVTWSDVEERAAGPDVSFGGPLPPRGNRRRALLGTAAVLIVVGALVGILVAQDRDDAQPIDSGPGSSTTATPETSTSTSAPTSPDPTTRRPSPPRAPSGARRSRCGRAPSTWCGAARSAATPGCGPTAGATTPPPGRHASSQWLPSHPDRQGAAGVWTGTEMIVCCGQAGFGSEEALGKGAPYDTASAAAYDPATDRWRVLAPPPEAGGGPGAVWTASEMLVLANTGNLRAPVAPVQPALFAYDPSTDEWSTRTAGPFLGQVAWSGERLVVLAPDSRAAAYDPATDTWSDLPDIPEDHPVDEGSIAWVDDQLVVWGIDRRNDSQTTGYRLRLGVDTWRPMAEAPIGPIDWYEGTPGSQSMGVDEVTSRLVIYPTHGYEHGGGTGNPPPTLLTYDPATDEWRDLAVSPVAGFAPYLTVVDRRLPIPDRSTPDLGLLPRVTAGRRGWRSSALRPRSKRVTIVADAKVAVGWLARESSNTRCESRLADQVEPASEVVGALSESADGVVLRFPDGREVSLPSSLVELMRASAQELADGHALTVLPSVAMLTPAETGELLGLSRPFVAHLLDEGEIPSDRLPGSRHRRIRLADVVAFSERRDRRREGRRRVAEAVADADLPY